MRVCTECHYAEGRYAKCRGTVVSDGEKKDVEWRRHQEISWMWSCRALSVAVACTVSGLVLNLEGFKSGIKKESMLQNFFKPLAS